MCYELNHVKTTKKYKGFMMKLLLSANIFPSKLFLMQTLTKAKQEIAQIKKST